MRYIGLLILGVFLSSCAQSRMRNNFSSDIKGFLDKQSSRYERKEMEDFFAGVSEQYYSNYKEFKYAVEDFLYNNAGINLEFKIEKILQGEEEQSVDVKWYKTYSDKQGNFRKIEGEAALIFDVSSEVPLLINIKGDNPFIQ